MLWWEHPALRTGKPVLSLKFRKLGFCFMCHTEVSDGWIDV